jgi:pimeloyl-ACP methyl ester carboxylesterase/uncharacterized RDD family membrane protein YckC
VERAVDGVLAGPLPEAIGRSVATHRAIERLAWALVENRRPGPRGDADDPEHPMLVDRVLHDPELERWISGDEARQLAERLSTEVVRSPAFKRAMVEVLGSPELRQAMSQQTSSLGATVVGAARKRTRTWDVIPEERVARLRRRHPSEPGARSQFGGLVTRGVALVMDAALANVAFLVAAASVLLVASLAGGWRPGWLAATIGSVGWLLVAAVYFAGFWSGLGQTPGMQVLGVRVVDGDGETPSAARSVLRFGALIVAILPLGAGFLPVLVDSRRRGLHDFIAGTRVLDDARAVPDGPGARPGDAPAHRQPGSDESTPRRKQSPRETALRSVWRNLGGLRVHAVTGGTGPPVVLVHGYGVSGAYMLPPARLLAESFSVLVPDLPGQGGSEQPRRPWGIREMAETLGAWLDEAQLREPAVVANSMGCQIVTELAVRRPGRLGPLVLIGPTVDPARRMARRQLFDALRDSAHEPLSLLALATHDHAVADIGPLLRTARAALSDRIEDRLPLIEQPAAVVYGEADGFVSRAWAERAAALLQRGRLVAIPSEPHAVHFTRPDLIADIVRELLVEEGEHRGGQLSRHLEHRDMAARKTHEASYRQEALPLVR